MQEKAFYQVGPCKIVKISALTLKEMETFGEF